MPSTSFHPLVMMPLWGAKGGKLVDDNQWHSITLDARVIREVFSAIKYLQSVQFYTQENSRKGHEFWVDDFAIVAMPERTPVP